MKPIKPTLRFVKGHFWYCVHCQCSARKLKKLRCMRRCATRSLEMRRR